MCLSREFFKYVCSLTAAAALFGTLFTSCTVDEPSEGEDGNPENYLLSSITTFGMPLMVFEYDDYNRPVSIKVEGALIYTFNYSGKSNAPESIDAKFYDTDDDENWYVDEHDVWTNIKLNKQGYIDSFDSEEKSEDGTDYAHRKLSYDADGHLTRIAEYYDGDPDIQYFDWQNGLLISWGEEEHQDHRQWWKAEYSDVDNTLGQWDPNNEFIGPLACTGLFGIAPRKFIKTAILYYNENPSEIIQYSYSLNENGLIRSSKVKDEEDGTLTFNYVYTKKK